ncbi:MAG: hypothetical protein AAFR52_16440, partial [Pseudomonadota bacterium]
MSATDTAGPPPIEDVLASVRRRRTVTFSILGAILLYLLYALVALDVPGLVSSARPERALLLGTDSVAYKVHVEKNLRRGGLEISVEGERRAVYDDPPPWVVPDGSDATVDLDEGYGVEIRGRTALFTVPEYGVIEAEAHDDGVTTRLPDGAVIGAVTPDGLVTTLPDGSEIRHLDDDMLQTVAPDGSVTDHPDNTQLEAILPAGLAPEWLDLDTRKTEARPTIGRRLQVTRTRIEVHKYFFGWENFWFDFDHPLNGRSWGELAGLATSSERLDPDISNAAYIANGFWYNQGWQHGHVFVALLETILMAVLGTMTAVLVGLPLAFLAARNFTISLPALFVVRRLFDF